MKKLAIFGLVLVLLAGCQAQGEVSIADIKPDSESGSPSAERTIQVKPSDVYSGDLLLVNGKHAAHTTVTDIINVYEHPELREGFALLDQSIRLSRDLVEHFSQMTAAAAKDDVNHFMISSGYRDKAEQELMYEQKGSDYALPPGYSEHNLGLSLDIGSTLKEMDVAPEGKWLKQNAPKYGFILRYPKGKEAITGIQYEAWHFRYVGLPHSQIMQANDFTLEEYLAYLKKHPSLVVTVDGKQYEIMYVPVSKKTSIQVPADDSYTISGNNVDGVVVTVSKSK